MKISIPPFLSIFLGILLTVSACQKPSDTQQNESDSTTTGEQASETAPAQETSSPDDSQELPPDDVALLGWSNDGKILAYRSFFLSESISRHSAINVEVVDIVSDKVLWEFSKSWDEGNAGEEGGETSPTSGAEAWSIVMDDVAPNVAVYNIVPGEEPESHETYGTFPFGGDIDAFSAEVTELTADNSYKVIASSMAQGQKTLMERKASPELLQEAQIVGYFMNPQSSRIAIIVKEIPMNPVVYFFITGCSLTTGFKAN